MGIEALYRKPNTSRKKADEPVYPYLLRELAIDRPNQVWVADITYITMRRGFVYLVTVLDNNAANEPCARSRSAARITSLPVRTPA